MNERCKTCDVERRVRESTEPACCVWFLENVVIKGDTVRNCPNYEHIKEET